MYNYMYMYIWFADTLINYNRPSGTEDVVRVYAEAATQVRYNVIIRMPVLGVLGKPNTIVYTCSTATSFKC